MKRTFMLAAVSVFLLAPCFGQAPAMSHDAQKFPISVEDCTRMGKRTLEREGYQMGTAGDNWVSGSREIHRALIMCHGAADGTWVDLVVSSNAQEYNVPSSEQRLLMNHMIDVINNRRFETDREDRDHDRDRDRDWDRDRDRDHRANWLTMTVQQPVPGNAIAGGKEPNHPVPQFVCRAEHEGNWVPGKTVTALSSTDCLIPYREMEVRKTTFDVLTGDHDDYVWMAPNGARRPFYTGNEGAAQLRSCRFELYVRNEDKGLQVGKEASGRCFVGFKGITYSSDRYEVLYASR
jgi:hypothetical protein